MADVVAAGAVVVERVGEGVDAVGDGGDGGAHAARAV